MAIALPQPQHRTLSIMPTYRCTASCKSCGTLSSPHSKERLETTEVLAAISQAHEVGIGLVVFTGGEATLEEESLFEGLTHATALRLKTRLVTNGHWASTDAASDSYMCKLQAAGLEEINFSTGDQHARFVPLEHVLRGVRSALTLGFTPAVMVETTAENRITGQVVTDHEYHRATIKMFPGRLVKIHESPWMPLHAKRVEKYAPGTAIDRSNLASAPGCDSVLQTVTVQADGRIGACCGLGMRLIPELNLGKLGEVTIGEAMEEAQEDLLKRWIRLEGPERILAWAATKDPRIEWEGMYAHRCQACLRLYKDEMVADAIREHYQEKVADIVFGEYLLYGLDGAPSGSGAVVQMDAEALKRP